MIVLNSFKKIDIIYRNYIKQYSKAYINGYYNTFYISDSLYNIPLIEQLKIIDFIKKYSDSYIKIYNNNNKLYDELILNNICTVCLEELNNKKCNKCNINYKKLINTKIVNNKILDKYKIVYSNNTILLISMLYIFYIYYYIIHI